MIRRWRRELLDELDVIVARDPSVRSRGEAAWHPSLLAVLGHRVANRLYHSGRRRLARALAALVRLVTGGIEIHPGARITAAAWSSGRRRSSATTSRCSTR